ncbi:MAG TPA: glycosyltransferase family 2 protein [Candidatus Binataceae bacterium]|nr:glycosyltransferase family 2 protein [Candidatus Binataceae bacterium]
MTPQTLFQHPADEQAGDVASRDVPNGADRLPDISTIIVSFNTRELLRECLATLGRETANLAHETIVVDNASRDGSAEMVAAEFPAVRLIRSTTNLGFAAANNHGFGVARGRYVILLNSDAFPRPEAIRRALELMEAHPEVGLGGGRLVGRDDSWQPSARMFPSLFNDLLMVSGLAARYPRSRILGRADRTWADPLEPAATDWLPGAFVIIRREVLERVGWFDERFFLYSEEIDLCRRIKAAGYQIWYWPQIVVVHLGGESSKTVERAQMSKAGSQLTLWRMRSQLLYCRKHHGAFGAWGVATLEIWWNRLRAWRNGILSRDADKVRESRVTISLMKQAWRETRGGAISPARPW